MTLDWNWFFSSLSQSAAAIVGIFGAFIITKIFSNQTIFLEKTNKMRMLTTQAQNISDRANSQNIEWYNRIWNEGVYARYYRYFDENFPNAEFADDITDAGIIKYMEESNFSIFSEKAEIEKELREITNTICAENKARRDRERKFKSMQTDNSLGSVGKLLQGLQPYMQTHFQPPQRQYNLLTAPPWDRLQKVRDELKENYLDAKHHARVISDFLESIRGNPESPPQITYSLILVLFLFFVGVIYPLSFMPASPHPTLGISLELLLEYSLSLKGFFLVTISIAFTVIVLLFFYTNIKMKYPEHPVKKLEELSHLQNYCENFKFLDS